MFQKKQRNATSSEEEQEVFQSTIIFDDADGNVNERIISDGSAEEESVSNKQEIFIGNTTQRHRWSKKEKAVTVASALLLVGAVVFVVGIFRPGGGNPSIQSSRGMFIDGDTYTPTFFPTSDVGDLDELPSPPPSYFPTSFVPTTSSSPSTPTPAPTENNSGNGSGDGEVPSLAPTPSQNYSDDADAGSGDGGSGELPPPFVTLFPMETPIPTSMPSIFATVSSTPIVTGEGTTTVSAETTGPPTMPGRDPVRK
jgi:hypothetical protein